MECGARGKEEEEERGGLVCQRERQGEGEGSGWVGKEDGWWIENDGSI